MKILHMGWIGPKTLGVGTLHVGKLSSRQTWWLAWRTHAEYLNRTSAPYFLAVTLLRLLILEKEPRLSSKSLEAVCNHLPQSHELEAWIFINENSFDAFKQATLTKMTE